MYTPHCIAQLTLPNALHACTLCCTAQLTPPIVHHTHHIAQLAHLPPVSAHCSVQTPSSVCTAHCKHACTSHHVNCSHRKATHCSPCAFVTALMPPMCCMRCTLPPAWHPVHLHSIPAHLLCSCTGFALVRDRLQRRAAYPRCATLCKGSPGWAAASSMQAASAPPLRHQPRLNSLRASRQQCILLFTSEFRAAFPCGGPGASLLDTKWFSPCCTGLWQCRGAPAEDNSLLPQLPKM